MPIGQLTIDGRRYMVVDESEYSFSAPWKRTRFSIRPEMVDPSAPRDRKWRNSRCRPRLTGVFFGISRAIVES